MKDTNREKAPKLEMKDAGDYFDDPVEKEEIMRAVQGIFRVNKSQEYEQKLYGVPYLDWDSCRVNPRVIAKLNQESDSDSDENIDPKKAKDKLKKKEAQAKMTYDD